MVPSDWPSLGKKLRAQRHYTVSALGISWQYSQLLSIPTSDKTESPVVSLSQYYYLHAILWLSYTQPSRIFGDQSWERRREASGYWTGPPKLRARWHSVYRVFPTTCYTFSTHVVSFSEHMTSILWTNHCPPLVLPRKLREKNNKYFFWNDTSFVNHPVLMAGLPSRPPAPRLESFGGREGDFSRVSARNAPLKHTYTARPRSVASRCPKRTFLMEHPVRRPVLLSM